MYLLLNYDSSDNISYNFSIWSYSYDNKNFDKILDCYDDSNNSNDDSNQDIFDVSSSLKPDNIFKTLKFGSNLFFD